jgi:Zn-dependent M28 family amino/carboxypeptidase
MLNIFQGIHTGPLPPLTSDEAELSKNLYKHIDMLAGVIGARNALDRPEALEAAVGYIEKTLAALGFTTASQPYVLRSGRTVRNIDAELIGHGTPREILVVGAHYDSVAFGGCPGANDNASGVAATLEIARLLREKTLKRTVRFVAFVNEEPPFFQTDLMGSYVYARRCRERNETIVGMITPETIGCYFDEPGTQSFPLPLGMVYPTVGNLIAFVGNAASRRLVDRVTTIFRATTKFPAVGFAAPKWVTKAGWSDHWSFWQFGYPGLMATDTAPLRYKHYHTRQDTPDKIEYDRTARVVMGFGRVIITLADE